MNTRVELNKTVFDKTKYVKTIDNSFKEFLPPQPVEENDIITIEEFFVTYDNLFFDIPKTGVNSHNTLIQKSSEYVGDEQTNEELDALYAEITSLRTDLLATQQELVELQTAQAELLQNNIDG